MPYTDWNYSTPNWTNDTSPAINANNLRDIGSALEKLNIDSNRFGLFGAQSTDTLGDICGQIYYPAGFIKPSGFRYNAEYVTIDLISNVSAPLLFVNPKYENMVGYPNYSLIAVSDMSGIIKITQQSNINTLELNIITNKNCSTINWDPNYLSFYNFSDINSPIRTQLAQSQSPLNEYISSGLPGVKWFRTTFNINQITINPGTYLFNFPTYLMNIN